MRLGSGDGSPAWALSLCGGFSLSNGGGRVQFARRKSEVLIAWLALHSDWQARKKIAEAIWPDAAPEDALRSLRVTLTDVRKTVGDDFIERDPHNRLRLSQAVYGPQGTDVERLESNAVLCQQLQQTHQVLDASLLSESLLVLTEVSGDLLPDWDEAWLLPLRHQVAICWLGLARYWIEHGGQATQWTQVLELTQRALTLSPCDEWMHQQRMMAFAGLGQRQMALQQYQICHSTLKAQGREPVEATVSLWQRLRQQENRGNPPRLGNLPRPLTSFVGREDELNQIETWLKRSRVLTLIGPGGSGKTRLAIQAAHEVAYAYPDGVWWVDLAALKDGTQIPKVLTELWGIHEREETPLLNLVTEHLGRQNVLLIFDNCEHLLEASAQFAHHLLVHCPSISLIATSRESLGIEAEVIWETPVLSLPDIHHSDVDHASTSLSLLADNDAVRLWLERTQVVMPEFQLNADNASQVIQLCHALQGIPLAIELAAAQMAVMPLADLLNSLTLALDFQLPSTPASPQTTFQTRHRTLRAAIDWGYQLLNPAEQVFFRRLGVFSGGWTVALAAQVMFDVADGSALLALPSAAGLTALPLSAADLTRQILEALARKGVIQVRRSAQGLRYAMLDTLRDRARELCQDAGEWEAAQQSHFKALSHWSQKVAPQLWQHEQTKLAAQLQQDAANIEAALSWGSQHLPPEHGLAMAVDLARWWVLHSHFSWADRWLPPLLQSCEQKSSDENRRLRANAWLWISDFAYRRSQAPCAVDAAQKAEALFVALGDVLGQARAQVAQGIGWWLAGDDERAYQECHTGWQQLQRLRQTPLMQQSDYVGWSLIAANRLAEITRIQKRYAESVRYNQETAALSHNLGDVRGEAISIGNLGLIAVAQNEWAKGCGLLQISARMFQAVGEKHHFTYALQGIGQACLRAGHYAQAARFYGALDTYSRETGYTLFGPDQLSHQQDLAQLHHGLHDADVEKAWDDGRRLSTEQAQVLVINFRFELLTSGSEASSTTVCSADVTHGE